MACQGIGHGGIFVPTILRALSSMPCAQSVISYKTEKARQCEPFLFYNNRSSYAFRFSFFATTSFLTTTGFSSSCLALAKSTTIGDAIKIVE
jgi:hypothetical protein